jgi:ribosome-associated translation inhibitor RaiA
MSWSNVTNDHGFRIDIDPGNYRLSDGERAKMETDLVTLRKAVKDFPVSELKIELTILNPKSVRVGTGLRLANRTLFVADEDALLHPAWERCVRRLVHKVTAYKEKLANKHVYSKEQDGKVHQVRPGMVPDLAAVQKAIDEQDYTAFREAMAAFDETMEKRVGRWVQRYPEAQALLGTHLTISEIVEEVFLNAFERFGQRPAGAMGEWLETLIDESIRLLLSSEEERENLRMIQTARGVSLDETARGNEPGRIGP